MLSPQTEWVGKSLHQLLFQDKYQLTVWAIWRDGWAVLTGLRDLPLRFGDVLLLHGRRAKFAVLGREPDFPLLTEAAQETRQG